ncbi:hypothetical protein N9W69_03185 [Flavobacteriaceae bacterium]|nr:hypothetical protein [Flavobacteriaceae bacterium]
MSIKLTSTLLLIVLISFSCSKTNKWYFKEGGALLWVDSNHNEIAIKSAVKNTLENSSIIVAQVSWSPNDSSFFKNCSWYSSLARDHGKSFMIAIDWQNIERSGTTGDWSFASEETSRIFKKDMLKLLEAYHPDYINLGVEVNYYALTSPNGFNAFAPVFRELKNELKKQKPDVKVGLSYQLELLYGTHKGWDETKTLKTLDNLLGDLDYLGISTYPNMSLEQNQSQLLFSTKYLDSLINNYSLPIGISETAASSEIYSEEQRMAYVEAIFQKANDLNLMFVIWGSIIDGVVENDWSDKMGLLNAGGLPKKEFALWKEENVKLYK